MGALTSHYNNPVKTVATCMASMCDFPSVKEEEHDKLISAVRHIQGIYNQLTKIGQQERISYRECSEIIAKFPLSIRTKWSETFFELEQAAQLTPFKSLHDFMVRQLKIARIRFDTEKIYTASQASAKRNVNTVSQSHASDFSITDDFNKLDISSSNYASSSGNANSNASNSKTFNNTKFDSSGSNSKKAKVKDEEVY